MNKRGADEEYIPLHKPNPVWGASVLDVRRVPRQTRPQKGPHHHGLILDLWDPHKTLRDPTEILQFSGVWAAYLRVHLWADRRFGAALYQRDVANFDLREDWDVPSNLSGHGDPLCFDHGAVFRRS